MSGFEALPKFKTEKRKVFGGFLPFLPLAEDFPVRSLDLSNKITQLWLTGAIPASVNRRACPALIASG